MSFFGSKLFGGLTGGGGSGTGDIVSSAASSISGADTIERLCDRVQSSLLIDDRRDSLKEIKLLSKKFKLEVGTQAMPVLIDVLSQNKMDSEICCLVLEILYNVFTSNQQEAATNLPADISTQFIEMFTKDLSNTELLFDLLDEFDFNTRWSTLKLLNSLIVNQCERLQEIVLQIPRGVSRLIDLLNDSREIIRNDAILLLNSLVKTNANIQKIIAFESGFDRIMEIIDSEGSAIDGGVIVEDCFNLLLNLLQTNYSNQNFFKEANYIKQLCKYFDLNSASSNQASVVAKPKSSASSTYVDPLENSSGQQNGSVWTLQKTKNFSLLLKLIRCLVAPNNHQQIINDCQKAYSHFGLLHRLSAMLMVGGLPTELLSETISTVGEVIRGNKASQQLFSTVMVPTNPPSPIITILLLLMTNEKQPFHLRCSILYCIQCYLFKNEEKKSEIIAAYLPQDLSKKSANNSQQMQVDSGTLLFQGLFKINDFVSNWLCAIALSHTLNENNPLKEQFLKVQLVLNGQNVSLMQQCMNMLIESIDPTGQHQTQQQLISNHRLKFQTVISILIFLSTWMANCPIAVYNFLSQQQNIPYLISQVSSTDTEEKSLIIQGLSSFLLGLTMLYNSNQVPAYTVENLRDTIKKRIGIEQFEDKLEYISQHELYTKTLKKTTYTLKCKSSSDLLFDHEFTRLFKSNESLILNILTNKDNHLTNQLTSNCQTLNHVKNGNLSYTNNDDAKTLQQLEQQSSVIIQYQQIIREQDNKLKEQHQLNQLLTQTCSQLQENCQQLNNKLTSLAINQGNMNDNQSKDLREQQYLAERLQFQARINELEVKNNLLEEKCSEQEDELCKILREKGILQETINNLQTNDKNTDLIELKSQNNELKSNLSDLNKEQDSLLLLLQEMEDKLKKYKNLLKSYKCNQISDDEDENVYQSNDEQTNLSPPLNNTNVNLAESPTATAAAISSSASTPDTNHFNHNHNYNSNSAASSDKSFNVGINLNNLNINNNTSYTSTDSRSSGSASSNSTDINYKMSLPPPVGQNFNSLDLTTSSNLNYDAQQLTSSFQFGGSGQQQAQQQFHSNNATNNLQNYFN